MFRNYNSTSLHALATIGYIQHRNILFCLYKEVRHDIKMAQFHVNSTMSDSRIMTEI